MGERRLAALDAFLAVYEAEHGEITAEEMDAAAGPERSGRGASRVARRLMRVLDVGAFVAVERGDREVVALVKRERIAARVPVTSGAVVAQVWRGGTGDQAPVARLLAGTDVEDLRVLARAAGVHVELLPV